MKNVAIIQARMGSTRFPGKSMAEILGKPAIWHLFNQLRYSSKLDERILATTLNPLDDVLANYAVSQNWHVFRGSEQDVLDRYYQSAKHAGCKIGDVIVRVTGDDILVDPQLVDRLVDLFQENRSTVDHVSNNRVSSFPYGSDVEVFSYNALERAWNEARLPSEREHVTPYIRNNPDLFPFLEMRSPVDNSHIHLSIDHLEDLHFNQKIMSKLSEITQPPFHVDDIVKCIVMHDIKHKGNPV